jgi:hypothetical protein
MGEIPVVDSAVDDIPEGLVLLPAPRPVSRRRGVGLAVGALVMGATSIAIAVLGAGPSGGTGDQASPGLDHGRATLASATAVPGEPGGEDPGPVERGAGQTAAASSTPHDGSPPASRATERSDPPAQSAAEPPSAAPGPTQATTGGADTDGEEATTPDAADVSPATPAADGDDPELVLPDPPETVGDVVDHVTDSLPLPNPLGD